MISSAMEIMPVTMNTSATLKIAGIIHGIEIMSTTCPTRESGRAEQPVGEVAEHTAQQHAEHDRPQPRARCEKAFQTITPATTARAIVKIQVTLSPIEKAAPELRTK